MPKKAGCPRFAPAFGANLGVTALSKLQTW